MDVKRRDLASLLTRNDTLAKAAESTGKAVLPSRLPATQAPGGKPAPAGDTFERSGSSLFASMLSPRATAPGSALVSASRADAIAGAGAKLEASFEALIGQAGRLIRGDTNSQIETLREQLEQLKAQKQALKSAIQATIGELRSVQEASHQEDPHWLERLLSGGPPPADPKLAQLQRTVEQLKSELASVENQIKKVLQQIEAIREGEKAQKGVVQEAVDSARKSAEDTAAAIGYLRSTVAPDP